jgi:hypothetical protein
MGQYWNTRSASNYYKFIDNLFKQITTEIFDNKEISLIDVGCRDTEVIFEWPGKKTLLDIKNYYSTEQYNRLLKSGITFIQKSLYEYVPEEKYDLTLCLQTIEHLHEPAMAFEKLFDMSNYTIISLPYRWPPIDCHVYHRIDEETIFNWAKKEPISSTKIAEDKQSSCSVRIVNLYKN